MPELSLVLVDDEDDLRQLVRETLRLNGGFHIVGEAANGEDAVGVVEATRPDMVLLDLDMPVLGGLDALPRLRKASPHTRFVVLSGLEDREAAERSLAGGAVGFLQKGIRARSLVRELLVLGGVLDAVDGALEEMRTALPAALESPRAARRFVARALEQWNCAPAIDSVVLLVSEVVGNAIVHANSAVQVAVRLKPDAVRVEVTDSSDEALDPRPADADAESGRGLQLVEHLAARWGEKPLAVGGKVVWFEVPRLDEFGETQIR